MYSFINDILGAGGAFSKANPNYQVRQQQIQMAMVVQDAIANGKHALVEAGTGTGKTFAYLVPAIKYAVDNGKKVIVSTKTKNLQSQLVVKDLPFLEKVLPNNFKVEKIVGIGNFICFYRLLKHLKSDSIEDIKVIRNLVGFYCSDKSRFLEFHELAKVSQSLLDEKDDTKSESEKRIDAILSDDEDEVEVDPGDFSYSGTKEEFDETIDKKTWGEICAESDSCHRKSCPFFSECYYFKAKERQRAADVLVVNHALFFADLAVRKSTNFVMESAVIPKFDIVIFDEAHDIENVASDFMGIKVSNFKLKHFVSTLTHNFNKNQTLRKIVGNSYINSKVSKLVEDVIVESTNFFNEIRSKYEKEKVARVRKPGFVDATGLIASLERIKDEMTVIVERIAIKGEGEKGLETRDIAVFHDRTTVLINQIRILANLTERDWAYWVEVSATKVCVCGSPIHVAKELEGSLFGRVPSCVLTSATMAVNGNFDFICGRLGIDNEKAYKLVVGSPFNYFQQAMLCVPEDSMEPTLDNSEEYTKKIVEQIKKIIKITEGRAFVLFTSYKLMDDTYNSLREVFSDWGYPVYKQSPDCSREKMLSDFMENNNSILFGAESFWQGVDVPGEKLSCVIIPKMPFANPSEPIIAARLEYMKQKGLNAFMSYSLPDSIIRLKQGTGRLIRRESDKGVVAILDRRLFTKSYGGTVISSLPSYYRTKSIDDIKKVFQKTVE